MITTLATIKFLLSLTTQYPSHVKTEFQHDKLYDTVSDCNEEGKKRVEKQKASTADKQVTFNCHPINEETWKQLVDKRIFKCQHCGQTLDLSQLCVKGYIPDITRWRHFDTVNNVDCTDEDFHFKKPS